MPEIWLNYGAGDAIVDIRSENLGGVLDGNTAPLQADQLEHKLSGVTGTIVILHNTPAVRQTVSCLYAACERQSVPFPTILADRAMVPSIRAGLPEGCKVDPFRDMAEPDSEMVFVSEVTSDGLFGYQSTCTQLLRQFGEAAMLDAYRKRDGDMPLPGRDTVPYDRAQSFADRFEISSIDVLGSRGGVADLCVGHPSSPDVKRMARRLVSHGAGALSAVVGSVGDAATGSTLAGSLPALWSACSALKGGGQAVLLAECGKSLGSDSLRHLAEGRLNADEVRRPTRYVQGMEDLLFLYGVQNKVEVTLVSALPRLFTELLKINVVRRSQDVIDGMIRKNPRRKITVMLDASRTILVQDP